MRSIVLPFAALLLIPACKQAEAPAPAGTVAELVSFNQQAINDPRRVLDLEGGLNFRDLGGYRTDDGKKVRWQTVYRSGTPTNLTEKDVKTLGDLGIRTVCDFRADEERAAEPNPYVAANSSVEYWTRDYRMETSNWVDLFAGPDAGPEKSKTALIGLYRTLAEQNAESYRAMFKYLAEGKVPLAFNCAAGKDRAGVGAALLLTLLGVPRATVVADYALSDDIVDYRKEMIDSAADNPSYAALIQLPWENVEPLLASDPAYIEAALDALGEKYGSVDAFIEQELNVSPKMRQSIKANLLENL